MTVLTKQLWSLFKASVDLWPEEGITKYWISLMNVAQSLIFITSYYIYSRLLMILFPKLWCLLKAAFFWKTMLVVIYAKILHHSFITIIYERFNSIFLYLSCANENWETCIPVWFEQLKK